MICFPPLYALCIDKSVVNFALLFGFEGMVPITPLYTPPVRGASSRLRQLRVHEKYIALQQFLVCINGKNKSRQHLHYELHISERRKPCTSPEFTVHASSWICTWGVGTRRFSAVVGPHPAPG